MTPDFAATASWSMLRRRAALLKRIREFFDARGFIEVETPLLSADVVVDRHLDPLETTVFGRRIFLQTSPEFGMKRLLATADPDAPRGIYQITRAFRADEHGRLHNPEFTIIEWYRCGDRMAEGMQLLSELAQAALERGPAERLSYAEAFQRHAGLNPHRADVAALAAVGRNAGLTAPASLGDDRDAWLDWLLVERIEPHLGRGAPTIVCDYPASQAALAQVRDGDPPLAERFELYVDGIELANGYHELLDPAVLRERNRTNNALRRADGKSELPEHSRLIAAMETGLPECTGVALGFDRLVMVATGAASLAEVMAFPIDRA
ncbi:MAG TPA: EF-P lysine aminoacylase EpmA [Pirellulales bacterium]|jgi:lysyl-tRNA synthetase class 2|nr:EF-P lysine aminoacylase EpmA [Pirellulales bacterium]